MRNALLWLGVLHKEGSHGRHEMPLPSARHSLPPPLPLPFQTGLCSSGSASLPVLWFQVVYWHEKGLESSYRTLFPPSHLQSNQSLLLVNIQSKPEHILLNNLVARNMHHFSRRLFSILFGKPLNLLPTGQLTSFSHFCCLLPFIPETAVSKMQVPRRQGWLKAAANYSMTPTTLQGLPALLPSMNTFPALLPSHLEMQQLYSN